MQPLNALCAPEKVLRAPEEALCAPEKVLRAPEEVLRTLVKVLCTPEKVLRTPKSNTENGDYTMRQTRIMILTVVGILNMVIIGCLGSCTQSTSPSAEQTPRQTKSPVPIRTTGTLGDILLDGEWAARLDKFMIDVDVDYYNTQDVHRFEFVVINPIPRTLRFDKVIATTLGENDSEHFTRFESRYELEVDMGLQLVATVPFGPVIKPQKFVLEIQEAGKSIGARMTFDVSEHEPALGPTAQRIKGK